VLDPHDFVNSGVLPDPHLPWLGDVFWIPAGWPLANVFSIGDLLIMLGAGWGAHRICGSRLVPGRLEWSPQERAETASGGAPGVAIRGQRAA